jgi:putative ABC transport system ATP-binding protein
LSVPVIRLEAVQLVLGSGPGRVHVLRVVDLDVEPGQTVGLTGPSGSGKSTLLMTMAGLERPDSGRIIIAGEDITALSEDRLAAFRGREVGIVFQSFHLIPNMTALENVAVPLELAGIGGAFDKAKRELELVGLADRATHYPTQLSGGEQQRVAVARALVGEPKILLADEPTGNLDEASGKQIADLIFRASAERGTTLVLVTHDLTLAARCDRVIRMHDGHAEPEKRPASRLQTA